MARDRRFYISGLNIRVHSRHEPGEYQQLWRALLRLRRVHVRGAFGLMIGDLQEGLGSRWGLTGYFYKFLQIDPNDPWFDIRRRQEANEADVAQVSIPNNLKPNLKQVPYFFDTAKHRLYFISESSDGGVTAAQARKLIGALVSAETIIDRFGEVEITPIMDDSTLRSALEWPVIRSIFVEIEKPNPTDYDDDVEVMERMKRRGLKRETHLYVKDRKAETIVVDNIIEKQVKVAAENGEVEIRGINYQGVPEIMNSSGHPLRQPVSYDPSQQLPIDALVESVNR